jgi:hypothetical protein
MKLENSIVELRRMGGSGSRKNDDWLLLYIYYTSIEDV